MSRQPNITSFRERMKLEDVLADIKEYAGDETLPNRDILLPQAAGRVWHFAKELMNTPTAVESLLATIRVLRESSGPGKCSAEEELMNQLRRIGWECVGWLKESGLTPATHSAAGLQASDPQLQPLCAVVMRLTEFAGSASRTVGPATISAGNAGRWPSIFSGRSAPFSICPTPWSLLVRPSRKDARM